jgi:hypothetical protein
LTANRNYLSELTGFWRNPPAGRNRAWRPLAHARRAAGLAHNDTEESLDRLLAESWPRRRPLAHFAVSFVTYLRRFTQSITTLAALDGEWGWKQSPATQSRLALLSSQLVWIEQQVSSGTLREDWPETARRHGHWRRTSHAASRPAAIAAAGTPSADFAQPAAQPARAGLASRFPELTARPGPKRSFPGEMPPGTTIDA